MQDEYGKWKKIKREGRECEEGSTQEEVGEERCEKEDNRGNEEDERA